MFAVHGIGSIVGCMLTPLFAENSVATMGGDASIKGGWIEQNVNKSNLRDKLSNSMTNIKTQFISIQKDFDN